MGGKINCDTGGGITFRPESIIIGLASISPLNRLRSGLPLQALVSTAMTWLCISGIPIQNEGDSMEI